MNSTAEFVEVDLHAEEKKFILELAGFLVGDEVTQADLKNGRKKWIRFSPYVISELVGELSYHYNRSRSAYKSALLPGPSRRTRDLAAMKRSLVDMHLHPSCDGCA